MNFLVWSVMVSVRAIWRCCDKCSGVPRVYEIHKTRAKNDFLNYANSAPARSEKFWALACWRWRCGCGSVLLCRCISVCIYVSLKQKQKSETIYKTSRRTFSRISLHFLYKKILCAVWWKYSTTHVQIFNSMKVYIICGIIIILIVLNLYSNNLNFNWL